MRSAHPTRGSSSTATERRSIPPSRSSSFFYPTRLSSPSPARADPHDNAVAKSIFFSLKREDLYRRNYHLVAEFKKAVEDYIIFYNTKRPHRTLNYKCPNEMDKTAGAQAF